MKRLLGMIQGMWGKLNDEEQIIGRRIQETNIAQTTISQAFLQLQTQQQTLLSQQQPLTITSAEHTEDM